MSEEKKVVKKVGMSFEPEIAGTGKDGEMVVKDANYYTMLVSASQGTIYYCARDNKYYSGESTEECPDSRFKEQFLPYLRWDYDEFEEVTLKDGSTKKVSTFPPTPENIAKKRAELIHLAVDNAENPDMTAIIQATLPRELKLNEAYQRELNDAPANLKMLRKINSNL